MARPVVLVATTDPVMAYALKERLKAPCRELGLRLDICPDGDVEDEPLGARAYDSAEALFDHLDSVSRSAPMSLADTLVVLDVGANLEDAFSPAANSSDQGWHVTAQRRAGVAVELILRFPQIFPVILSPAVPTAENESDTHSPAVRDPAPFSKYRKPEEETWRGFNRLCELLCRHDKAPFARHVLALDAPLHFVSPLDRGAGLESTIIRFARGMRCWFDPTGLRTLVKNRFLGTLFGSSDNWDETVDQRRVLLERLGRVAVAIDEEREFAMLNAYAAYKFGRRAWMVTTFAEFDDKPLWTTRAGAEELDVIVLRDIDLRFPDLPDSDESSARADAVEKLEEEKRYPRTQLLSIQSPIWRACFEGKPRISSSERWRVRAVSSNPDVKENVCWWKDEDRRLGEHDGKYYGLVKPISSLYELLSLLERLKTGSHSVLSRLESVSTEGAGNRHGAPYLNLAMAESLLLQGKYCKNGPVENIFGALYAGEAYELLLGMSKTTALEALLAQHNHEAAAEVMFPGVSHAIDIKPRQEDIGVTLGNLTLGARRAGKSRRAHRGPGYLSKMNGSASGRNKSVQHMFLSQFWAELKVVYRDGEQFTAAEMANKQSLIHGKYFKIAFIDAVWRFIKRWLLVPVATSFGWWTVASIASIVLLTIGYAYVSGRPFDELVLSTTLSSITLQPTSHVNQILGDPNPQQLVVGIVHMGLSYLLFGVLISMLYRKVTRG